MSLCTGVPGCRYPDRLSFALGPERRALPAPQIRAILVCCRLAGTLVGKFRGDSYANKTDIALRSLTGGQESLGRPLLGPPQGLSKFAFTA